MPSARRSLGHGKEASLNTAINSSSEPESGIVFLIASVWSNVGISAQMSKCVQPVVLGDEVGKRAQTGNGKQAKRQNLHPVSYTHLDVYKRQSSVSLSGVNASWRSK